MATRRPLPIAPCPYPLVPCPLAPCPLAPVPCPTFPADSPDARGTNAVVRHLEGLQVAHGRMAARARVDGHGVRLVRRAVVAWQRPQSAPSAWPVSVLACHACGVVARRALGLPPPGVFLRQVRRLARPGRCAAGQEGRRPQGTTPTARLLDMVVAPQARPSRAVRTASFAASLPNTSAAPLPAPLISPSPIHWAAPWTSPAAYKPRMPGRRHRAPAAARSSSHRPSS